MSPLSGEECELMVMPALVLYMNLNKNWTSYHNGGTWLMKNEHTIEVLHGKSQQIICTCLEPEIALLIF